MILHSKAAVNVSIADIIINKKIPIGAGLGGGSSNAATVIMAINKLGKFNFSNTDL